MLIKYLPRPPRTVTVIFIVNTVTAVAAVVAGLYLFPMFSTGRTIPSVGSHVVAQQPKAGGVQQRPGGVAVRRSWREKGQVPHQTCRARGK